MFTNIIPSHSHTYTLNLNFHTYEHPHPHTQPPSKQKDTHTDSHMLTRTCNCSYKHLLKHLQLHSVQNHKIRRVLFPQMQSIPRPCYEKH